MAVARPVRFLGAFSIILIIFLVYQLSQPTKTINLPIHHDGEKIEKMERDPLLDRMLSHFLDYVP